MLKISGLRAHAAVGQLQNDFEYLEGFRNGQQRGNGKGLPHHGDGDVHHALPCGGAVDGGALVHIFGDQVQPRQENGGKRGQGSMGRSR